MSTSDAALKSLNIPKNYILFGSLGGLFLGFLFGGIAKQWDIDLLYSASSVLQPFGTLWINALRMIVIPLIVAYIVTAVASFSEVKSTLRIGGSAVLAHLIYLVLGMGLMILVTPKLVSFLEVTPEIKEALSTHTAETPAATGVANAQSITDSIAYFIPENLFEAAVNEEILPLFIATLLFALALTKISKQNRRVITRFFDAVIETLHVLIGWILMAMPAAVFILVFEVAVQAGMELFTALAYFVLLFSGLLILLTLALYIITPLLANVSVIQFAKACAPAQIMAVGTRSSMVCLPALIDGAKEHLKLPASVSGLVLPLAVSMFKVNKAVSAPLKMFFLVHIYGLTLDPLSVTLFFLAYIPLSFSSPGIPSGGFFVSLPLYIALGIPVEGVVLLRTVDAIPDIFKTVSNVTEDMSVTALVARFSGSPKLASSEISDLSAGT